MRGEQENDEKSGDHGEGPPFARPPGRKEARGWRGRYGCRIFENLGGPTKFQTQHCEKNNPAGVVGYGNLFTLTHAPRSDRPEKPLTFMLFGGNCLKRDSFKTRMTSD